jgi:predicted phosphoribosyltransferase
VVFAAPVCSSEGAAELRKVTDEVVCLDCPRDFRAVGLWYQDFTPTSDREVVDALRLVAGRKVEV